MTTHNNKEIAEDFLGPKYLTDKLGAKTVQRMRECLVRILDQKDIALKEARESREAVADNLDHSRKALAEKIKELCEAREEIERLSKLLQSTNPITVYEVALKETARLRTWAERTREVMNDVSLVRQAFGFGGTAWSKLDDVMSTFPGEMRKEK